MPDPSPTDGDAPRDYTDPTVPGAADDDDRPREPADAARAGSTRPDDPDPDAPTDEVWEGNTLVGPGPGA